MFRLSIILLFISSGILSQNQDLKLDEIKPGGVKLYLNEDSTSHFRFFGFTHIWARYTEMNPGTTDLKGNPLEYDLDVGIRRNRSGFYFNFSDRLTSLVQFGISGQTHTSQRNPAIIFLDLSSEYGFIPEKLHVGYGLHSYNGIVRQGNVGAPHFLMVDNPGFSYPLVGTFDQSGRQLGVYAKGLLNRFEYRVSVAKPFSYNALEDIETMPGIAYENWNNNLAYKGYFNFQFLDREKDVFPWKRMTYLGKKKVFNLGAGFHYHADAMISFSESENNRTNQHDMLLSGVDAFLELPQRGNSSFTAYLAFFNYDFGPNYLRKGGLMNTGTGGSIRGEPLLQGGGNSEWSHGTGNIFHIETGYLFPAYKWLNGKQVQVFTAYTHKRLEALAASLHNYDFGINYYISGQHVKCGLQFSLRPIYDGTTGGEATGSIHSYKNTVIFNTQIDF